MAVDHDTQHAGEVRLIEAQRYARFIEIGTYVGLLMLVLGFAAYVSGLLEPFVPMDRLPELWNQPVDRYLALTQSPQGWGWLQQVMRGDFFNLLGIAVLSGCSIPPLLALIPHFLRHKNRAYAIICGLEVLLLLLAASGLLTSGH